MAFCLRREAIKVHNVSLAMQISLECPQRLFKTFWIKFFEPVRAILTSTQDSGGLCKSSWFVFEAVPVP